VNRILRRWSRERVGSEFSAVWPFEFEDGALDDRIRLGRSQPDRLGTRANPVDVMPDRHSGTPSRSPDRTDVTPPTVTARRSSGRAVEAHAANTLVQHDAVGQRGISTVTPTVVEQTISLPPAGLPRRARVRRTQDVTFTRPTVTPAPERTGERLQAAQSSALTVVRVRRIAGEAPSVRRLSPSEQSIATLSAEVRERDVRGAAPDRPVGFGNVRAGNETGDARQQPPIVHGQTAWKATVPLTIATTQSSVLSPVHRKVDPSDRAKPPAIGGEAVTTQASGASPVAASRADRRGDPPGVMRVRHAPTVRAPSPSDVAIAAPIHRYPMAWADVGTPPAMQCLESVRTRERGDVSGVPSATPAAATCSPPHDSTTASPPQFAGMTLDELVECVVRRLARRVAIEAERKGVSSWRSRS
jgi:hypothetical protein